MQLAITLFLLGLGFEASRGQGCVNQRSDVQIQVPEPPEGIQNLGSNPTYGGIIVTGTPAGTTLEINFDETTPQAVRDAANKVRINPRDSSGNFFLQMIVPIDRDGPTASSVDDENQIRFTMRCTENGVDYFFEVRLIILDINDNSPQFVYPNGLPYAVSLNELTPVGSSVYIQISATDKDNGPNKEIEYSLIPGNGQVTDGYQKFEILRSSHGFVTVKNVLDFESLNAIGQTSYILNVSASDLAQSIPDRRRSFTTLNITILDGDDLGPEFVYTSCFKYRSVCLNPEYTASVVSGAATGRLTVNSVPADSSGSVLIQAKDQDTLNYPVIFSIETTVPAGYDGFFRVDTVGPTGGLYEAQITQIQPLTRATVPNLRIILKATETSSNSRYDRAIIYLTVEAASASAPQLSTSTGTLTGYMRENSPVDTYVKDQPLRNIMKILVTDPNVASSDPTPSYSFQAIPNTTFRADPEGYLRLVAQTLDFETTPVYTFNVLVRETSTVERRSASLSLTVSLVDQQEQQEDPAPGGGGSGGNCSPFQGNGGVALRCCSGWVGLLIAVCLSITSRLSPGL